MGRRARWVGLAALLIAMGGGFACRQIVGITDNPPEHLTSTLCGLPYGTNVCASCVDTSCCAESTACAADPVCSAYEGCLGNCNGDPKCRSQCTIDNPVGTASDVSALSACLAAHCEAECDLTCGDMAAYITPPDASAPCEKCFEGACDQTRACASSVDCDAYTRCFVACPTPDCRQACATAHDAGAALFAPVQQVYGSACSIACAYGNNWNCVGHVVWPVAKGSTEMWSQRVIDYATHSPVPGLDVLWCTGCPCPTATNIVLAEGQTDDAGTVKVRFPFFLNASGVPSNVCGQITSPAAPPSIVPTFSYYDFAVSEPAFVVTSMTSLTLASQVLTPDESAQYAMLNGVTPDPTRGQVGVLVFDCLGSLAAGVQVTTNLSDAGGVTVVNSTDAGTNSSGLVVFFNFPSGNVTLTATPGGLGKPAAVFAVTVAAGTLTGVGMFPTP